MSEKIYSKIYAPGEDIIRMGDRGRNAYFIERGMVEIVVPASESGGEGAKILGTMGAGEIFGEMSMIDDAPRSATVTAMEETEVIVIEGARYIQPLESANPMITLILRIVLSRLRDARRQNVGGGAVLRAEDASMHEIRALAFEHLQFERDMREGLESNQFEVHYQPIIHLGDGTVAGFEALMRWRKGDHFVSPGEFIPLAEETGMIVDLGRFALRQGLKEHLTFTEILGNQPFMSINLSGLQLMDISEIDALADIISDSQVDPAQIKLEVTETLMVENFVHATEALRKLKALGVMIAIDDFGTGYSSLSCLHQLPLDTLKIDRTFVAGIEKSEKSKRVVESIAHLALALDMNIVAEGIEDKEQMSALDALGCHYGQGFYMCRPLPYDKAVAFLEARPSW